MLYVVELLEARERLNRIRGSLDKSELLLSCILEQRKAHARPSLAACDRVCPG